MDGNGTHIRNLFEETLHEQGWFSMDEVLRREQNMAFRHNNGSRYATDPHDMEILEEIK